MAAPTQKPNGSWTVVVNHAGQQSRVTAPTKELAKRAAAAKYLEMGGRLERAERTVADLLADYRATPRAGKWSPRYAEDINRVADRLPDWFTEMPVVDVDPSHVELLYDELASDVRDTRGKVLVEGFTANRIVRLHTLLLPAFKRAAKFNWCSSNPVAAVDPPTPDRPNIRPPTPEEVATLLRSVAGTVIGLYIELAAVAGSRRGEMVALKWEDLNGDTLSIHRSASWTPANVDADWTTGLVIKDTTKTGAKGERSIVLPRHIVDGLAALRKEQIEARLADGLGGQPEWIFSHDQGVTPWRPDYATDVFMQVRDKAGVTGVRLHDMRHFTATQLLAKGVPVSVVAHRLGHDVTTTQRTYSRYTLAEDQAAADVMGRIIAQG